MTTQEQKIEELYQQIISPEIMDFQIHVREVTGGNDKSIVDCTKLGGATRNALKEMHTFTQSQLYAELRGKLPEIKQTTISYKGVQKPHKKFVKNTGFNECRDIVLSLLPPTELPHE